MAILRRLFGGKSNGGYERAIALVESGRLAEALPLLRDAYAVDQASPRGSLAGYYLRLSLVGEGRRLLQAGEAEAARQLLAEAVNHWPEFPDLGFLAGAAAAGAEAWPEALDHARAALRRNPDYCEARLLEAGALEALGRRSEAVTSLTALVESGRRVDHALARTLGQSTDDLTAEQHDLPALIRSAAVGDDTKHRLAQAVAHCRASRWEDGLAIFAELARTHPRYPDIRAKHGAALYQTGRLDEALVEVTAALDVKPRYRTAVTLHGLILAEQGHLAEAARYLADEVPRLEGTAGRHEELFLAYLRASLALLMGDLEQCRELLAGWSDLGRQFARAELLLVACEHLQGWRDAAQRRIDSLAAIWTADPELAFLRAAMLLEERQWAAVEAAIGRWPSSAGSDRDDRPLLLQARLDAARGRAPELPETWASDTAALVDPLAWQQLAAYRDLLQGDHAGASTLLASLTVRGLADEETGRLVLAAATGTDGDAVDAILASPVVPDSWVADLCRLHRRRGEAVRAEAILDVRRKLRPEQVRWSWLAAGFWLQPVRGWLA